MNHFRRLSKIVVSTLKSIVCIGQSSRATWISATTLYHYYRERELFWNWLGKCPRTDPISARYIARKYLSYSPTTFGCIDGSIGQHHKRPRHRQPLGADGEWSSWGKRKGKPPRSSSPTLGKRNGKTLVKYNIKIYKKITCFHIKVFKLITIFLK